MSKQEIIKIFGDRKIRSVWDDEAETWYFSIVDVVAVLTESKDPLAYWRKQELLMSIPTTCCRHQTGHRRSNDTNTVKQRRKHK